MKKVFIAEDEQGKLKAYEESGKRFYLVKDSYKYIKNNLDISICRLTLGLNGDGTYNYYYDIHRKDYGWLTLPRRLGLKPEQYFLEYGYEVLAEAEDYGTLEFMKELTV